jgi:hypothetical protein
VIEAAGIVVAQLLCVDFTVTTFPTAIVPLIGVEDV